MKRSIGILLAFILLVSSFITVSANEGPSAIQADLYIQPLKTYDYVDTYYIGDMPYKCYNDPEIDSRLYVKGKEEETKTYVISEEELRKLEMIYLVNRKNKNWWGIKHVLWKDINETAKSVNDTYEFITSSLGMTIISREMGNLAGSYVGTKTSSGIGAVDDMSDLASLANGSKEDVENYSRNYIERTVVDSLQYCMYSLNIANETYDDLSKEDLKKYENIEIIYNHYEFASDLYTSSLSYIEKVISPRYNSIGNWISTISGAFINAGVESSFGGIESIIYHLGSYSYKNDELLRLKEEVNPTTEDWIAVYDMPEHIYYGTLTNRQKKLINFLGKYDSDFLEFYNKLIENEYTLLSDLTDRALANVNSHFGNLPVFELSNWAVASVENLKLDGILPEQAVYYFKRDISREKFCENIYSVVLKLDASKIPDTVTDKFIDTDNRKILALSEIGLINGTSTNEFSPNELITREAAAVVIDRMLKLFDFKNIDEIRTEFSDSSLISSWAKDSVRYVASQGIINGNGNNMFNPKYNLTYEQVFVIMNNVLSRANSMPMDEIALLIMEYMYENNYKGISDQVHPHKSVYIGVDSLFVSVEEDMNEYMFGKVEVENAITTNINWFDANSWSQKSAPLSGFISIDHNKDDFEVSINDFGDGKYHFDVELLEENYQRNFSNSEFVSFYYEGSAEYGYQNWCIVNLVFEQICGEYYLIGILSVDGFSW